MRLALPSPVGEHPAPPFPWLGALAPIAGAAVLFALTRSPFALAFAALGPVMAVGAMVGGRRQARRARRRDVVRRTQELEQLSRDIAELHVRELEERRIDAPSARSLLAAAGSAPVGASAGPLVIRIGTGEVPSGIRLDPQTPSDREIAEAAGRLSDAPVTMDVRGGVGLVGDPAVARALGRGLAVQLRRLGADPGTHIVHAREVAALHGRCAVVVEIASPRRARIVRGARQAAIGWFRPELLTAAETPLAGQRQARHEPPPSARLALEGAPGSRGALEASFLVTARGVHPVDLVRDGPHALVGGTTGSGKSELLVSWLLALADAYPPEGLRMLLVDFKGGAAFDPLVPLPHVDGLVTDLDAAVIDRAAAALVAELRHRESELRAHGARTIEEHPGLPRLVVVVDEFAALLSARGGLHEVFADIAARGRSLGVHLILCTQRPAGAVRDSLLANCALRISLRVVDRGDSQAVVGTGAAAAIPRSAPGRCVVALHGDEPFTAQVAMAPEPLDGAVETLAGRYGPAPSMTGWLPPLPAPIPLSPLLAETDTAAVVLGRADEPERGAQPVALWDPPRDGALVVTGAGGSGRSEAARTIASQLGAVLIDGHDDAAGEQVWDALTDADRRPLVIDDLDHALDRLDPEHQAAASELFPAMVRRRARAVAVTVGSPAASHVRQVIGPLGGRLLLRAASRDEHGLSGGPPGLWDAKAGPGAGVWRDRRVQVALAEADAARGPAMARCEAYRFGGDAVVALVTESPSRRLEALRAHAGLAVVDARGQDALAAASAPAGSAPMVVVGDPETWQSGIALWPLLAGNPVLFDCGLAAYRAVSRDRALPPALADAADRAWLRRPERTVVRVEPVWDARDEPGA